MNKRGHVLNALLLSVGIAYILEPVGSGHVLAPLGFTPDPITVDRVSTLGRTIVEVTLPVVLGALFPDVDTAFGKHRKTLHNLAVLGVFLAFPYVFGNLQFVWIGIATHYVLDVMGSRRGIALFYPYSKEYNLPFGVPVSSDRADLVTALVTGVELAAIALVYYQLPVVLEYGRQALAA